MITHYIDLLAGAEVTQMDIRRAHQNVSFSAVFSPPLNADESVRYVPVERTATPECDPHTQRVVRGASELVEGTWRETWNIVSKSPEEIDAAIAKRRSDMRAQVKTRYAASREAGFAYGFPDGDGVVQIRDAEDTGNINGLVTMALVLQAQNVTAPFASFRDEADVNHPLTPAQMVSMGMEVGAYVSGQLAVKWNLEAMIDAAVDMSELDLIDVSAGWGQ
jgi:hypothetical protein